MDTCQEPLRKNRQVDNGVIVSRSEPDPCPESPYGITLIFTSHFLWGVTSGMCTAAGFLNYGSVCVHACDTLLMIMMMYMIPGCPLSDWWGVAGNIQLVCALGKELRKWLILYDYLFWSCCARTDILFWWTYSVWEMQFAALSVCACVCVCAVCAGSGKQWLLDHMELIRTKFPSLLSGL